MRKTWSLWGSVPSNWSSSQTFVLCEVLEGLQCEDLARLLIALARFAKMTVESVSSTLEMLGESKLESGSSLGGSFGGSPLGMPSAPGGFWVEVCMKWGGEWKLVTEEASPLECSLVCAPGVGDSVWALEAKAEVACCWQIEKPQKCLADLGLCQLLPKRLRGLKQGDACVPRAWVWEQVWVPIGVRVWLTSMSLNICTVKTGFTPEVTLRKSRVEGSWDLASPYVVCPCLHAQ